MKLPGMDHDPEILQLLAANNSTVMAEWLRVQALEATSKQKRKKKDKQ